ncbi:MAG TPA: sugar nucleotide-binding protein, partial [Longimicrobiaceae bacterium]|nr:sugar nucleotide-binding protein [Longimicrobiaceae bacterium]
RAVALAMRAIREIVPSARLVQTEDLGRVSSTAPLSYQAEFENERRWLTWDLLCGRVGRHHPMWSYLLQHGVRTAELEPLLDAPCPPDVIGVNHYLTSERFLDHRLERYPPHTHGGNGRHAYADVEAVRVGEAGLAGPHVLLREAWDRYGLPLAVTEAHLGCTREEQLRWLHEVWQAAQALRQESVELRAVTVWSLLGAYDWNCLLTRDDGHYEPGAFDLRAPRPRPTALARMARALATRGEHEHPVLAVPGWWRRPERLIYPPCRATPAADSGAGGADAVEAAPLLITGATGTLGRAFARICAARAIPHRLLKRREMDIADGASVEAALARHRPWAVVNAAGYVRVDDAEREPEACLRENTQGPATLAAACARHGVALLTFSSDLVFDGTRATPYVESDPVRPLGVYGCSKAEAEHRVLEALSSALVVRTSAFFGPWDEYNFVTLALRALVEGNRWPAADDQVVSPTYVPDLVHASLDLLLDSESGIWHLANPGAVSWVELARTAAELAGVESYHLEARPTDTFGLAAARPRYSALGSERGTLLPSLHDALSRYLGECPVRLPEPAAVESTSSAG